MQHINEEYNNRFIMAYRGKTLTAKYGEYGSDLVVTFEGEGITPGENKTVITQIGNGFNAILDQGKYEEQWEPIPLENEGEGQE